MTDHDALFVRRAFQALQERVQDLPVEPNRFKDESVTRLFTNTAGDDVRVTQDLGEDPYIAVQVESRNFDPNAAYDPSMVSSYRRHFYLWLEEDRLGDALCHEVDRYPEGWSYGEPKNNLAVGDFEVLASLSGLEFILRKPANLSAASKRDRRRHTYQHDVKGPAVETMAAWQHLSPEDRVAFLLLDPPGLSVRPLQVVRSPLNVASDMLELTVPANNVKVGQGWRSDAREHLGWSQTFERFAENEAARRGIDLDEARERLGVETVLAQVLPPRRRSYRVDAETAYAIEGSAIPERDVFGRIAAKRVTAAWSSFITSTSVNGPVLMGDSRSARHLVEAISSEVTARFSGQNLFQTSAFTPRVMGIITTSNGRPVPPSLLVEYGDVVLRRELGGENKFFLTVAANTGTGLVVQSDGVAVATQREIGERLIALRQWRDSGQPVAMSPFWEQRVTSPLDVDFDSDSVLKAISADTSLHLAIHVDFATPDIGINRRTSGIEF